MRPAQSRTFSLEVILMGAFIALCCSGSLSQAQLAGPLPPELEGVGVEEKLGNQIPLDAEFLDESGKPIRLRDCFDGKKPVLLTLNYFGCPMLCGLQLNGMLEALKEMSWSPGREFEMITLSFDPNETPILAKNKKQNYLREYGRAEAASGWHFLTGREQNIRALTDAVGFGFKYNEERGEYMHTAALILLTPQGKVSRYLYGVVYEPETIRLSLVEASEGKFINTLDKLILFCYHYDATEGRYSLAAMNLARFIGVITVLVIGGFLIHFWRREMKRPISTTIEGQHT
ncbi:MAG: hypothetical protein DIKNOCCD_00075 [bacterium]|nr:SCO family protein [bacterium]MBK7495451.1 SCO family protein [Candidatus Omnitrophota bacterium]MBV6480372.1 hypothetical protein [bacterium]